MGKYVTAGDRFESFHPNYEAVNAQLALPRYDVPVLSSGIAADNRSIVLRTIPRAEAVNYAITLPFAHAGKDGALDLLGDLTGTEATWKASSGKATWTGWLPHLDLEVARAFTAASDEHRQLFGLLKKPGTLTLPAGLDLWQMLHPAVQPISKLDYEYPPETVTVVIKGGGSVQLKTTSQVTRVDRRESRVTLTAKQDQYLPLEITLATGGGEPKLEVSWFTDEDPRPRAFPLRRILMPFAVPYTTETPTKVAERHIPEIAGGDWQRGRNLFFDEHTGCFKCHQADGSGGRIGPDLSNVIYRDYASVLKDIEEPSAAINPDHIAYNIELKDGGSATGVVLQNNPDQLVLGQVTGTDLVIPSSNIASMKASSVSLMPEGLLKNLSAQQRRDLLTFLLTPRPVASK
jgi:putative heme-binding domain-containing protein